MSPRRGRHTVLHRHAHRALDAPLVLNAPFSLTQCIPTNITWTGGVEPYSLSVTSLNNQSDARIFDSINTTDFVWAPDMPSNTFVFLEVRDARDGINSAEDPIPILEKPPQASCNILVGVEGSSRASSSGVPPASSTSIFISFSKPLPSLDLSVTTLASSTISSSSSNFIVSASSTALHSQTPSSGPSVNGVSRVHSLSGSTIAAVIMAVVVFLLGTFQWWRSWLPWRRRGNRNGT